jgi:hypothetical protein
VSSTRNDAVAPVNKTPPPFPRPLPMRPVPTIASSGCISCFRLRALPPKKLTIFRIVVLRCHPTVTAPSHRGSSARFDENIRNVIIDVSLLCCRVAHLAMITGDDNRDSDGTDRATIATSRGWIATTTINHWKGRRERRWQSNR